jgi:hypothetical protein
MKQCPLCHRTYSDDFNYCLDDGSVLAAHQDDEETLVFPTLPTKSIPAPQSQPQRQGWTVLGVIGVILVVLVWGGIKLALWSADRESRSSAQSRNPAPTSFGPNVSPTPTPDCAIFGCDSPSPTPTITPSPSPTIAEPTEKMLSTGTYQCESSQLLNEGGIQTTRTLKYQFTFNADGTYAAQAYASIPLTGMNDRLYREEKGSYSQVGDQLTLRDRVERTFDFDADSWNPWVVAKSGSVNNNKIQSVTATTFQLYMKSEQRWLAFSKL